jgi:nucleotide-binding universal stress UspA family protein
MKRILVAVDGSEHAQRALDVALDLAPQLGAVLTLVYVVPPAAMLGEPTLINVMELERQHEQYAQGLLDGLRMKYASRTLTLEAHVLHGSPAEALADATTSLHADMIVVGTRGRNALARVLLGSVAHRLVVICPKPVLVVR